jgi:hypothetical protein
MPGLLVAGHPRDRRSLAQGFAINGPEKPGAGLDRGEERAGDVERGEELVVPVPGLDVEDHGPGRVGVIGYVGPSSGEVINKPGVHGPEGQLAGLGFLAGPGRVIEQPFDLGPGEVSVNDEAGLGPDLVGKPLAL